MMHICFITNEYPKTQFSHGGVGTFVQTISKSFIKLGHKVSVIGINVYTGIDEEENDNGVFIYRLKPKKIKGLTWYLNNQSINKKLREIHGKEPISIVETAELGLAFIKKIKPIKYIIRLHGGHHFFAESEERGINKWKGFQEKRSFKKADGFVAVSDFVKTHTEKYLSYFNKPLVKIPSPINLDVFKPKPNIDVLPYAILFAGTVCEKKGIRYLIKAMSKVIAQYPEVKLHIYGRDWFFPNGNSYVDYLKKEILPGLGDHSKHIIFHGAIPYKMLASKYAESQVCIFPSLMETQGLVAPEAMAMKKTVIFSKLGPGPETIKHKETGLLCNPYDINDISNQIIWTIKNEAESQKIAENARSFVLENFNIETLSHKNIEFYNRVIS